MLETYIYLHISRGNFSKATQNFNTQFNFFLK